ncbi:uncharacterized protein L199_007260 [Kwoniella botswanensis]|uniref:uncharacterized protein n=1 Tax=Kwoniella botswanensis TaxID=1268659 RepID=UPI00315D98E1
MNLKTYRSAGSIEADELTPEEKKDVTFHKDIWTADSCHKPSGTHLEDEDPADLSLERDPDLVWITVPAHFNIDNQYITYSNEMQTHSIYAAVGIKVRLPPAKNRSPIGGLNSHNKRRRED